MSYPFLSEQWFEKYDEYKQGIEVAPAFKGVVVNLRVTNSDQSLQLAYSDEGVLYLGETEKAQVTVIGGSEIIEKLMVHGELKKALPALFSRKISIEGDQQPLMRLAMAKFSETQKELGKKISEVTSL